MKSEKQIRKKLAKVCTMKCYARRRDDDAGLRAWCKLEKFIKWVLED